MIALDDGEPVGKEMTHGPGGANFALSPDGRRVLSGGADGRGRLWDAATGEPIGPELFQGRRVYPAFTPSGDAFLLIEPGENRATDETPGAVDVHATSTGARLARVEARSAILGIEFRPDGRSFLMCARDGTARLHEVATGRAIGETIRADSPIRRRTGVR